MAGYRNRRFTIFDAMEAKGIFSENPANPDARSDETGQSIYEKQEFPKMFYHPKGETQIIVPAHWIDTPLGPKQTDEQKEIKWAIAKDREGEKKLRAEGWHDHPAKAVEAGGGKAAPISADQHIEQLTAEIARLQAEKNESAAKILQPSVRPVTGKGA